MSDALKARLEVLQAWQDKVNVENKKKATGMAVIKAGESIPAPRLPTGSPALDIRLGGGWPRGAISEIFGPYGGGKSTLAYQTIAELHRRDPDALAVLVDVEGSYSGKRGAAMGIDDDRLFILRISTAESMVDELRALLAEQSNGQSAVSLVIIDSVAALVPEAEDEAGQGDVMIGVLARLMSRACRMLSAAAAKGGTAVIFTNQTREKIGAFVGNPETTPGGKALPFYAWSRVRISKIKDIKEGDDVLGQETKAIIHKAKLDDSYKGQAHFNVYNKFGIDVAYDIWRLGLPLGLIAKNGNALSAETPSGEVKGTGKESFIEALRANEGARTYLYQELVKTALSGDKKATETVDAAEEAFDAAEGEVESGLDSVA